MKDEFYFASIVCLSGLIRVKGMGNKCTLVLELTESVLGHQLKVSHETLKNDFDSFIEQTHRDYKRNYNPSATNDTQNYLTRRIHHYLHTTLQLVDYPHMTLVNGSWQNVDAPWIWGWIHMVTIHIDLHYGNDEKNFFIGLVKDLVGCSICKDHYITNYATLVRGLSNYSLTDLFLMLHTHTKINYGTDKFELSPKLINSMYRKKIFKDYNKLTG